MVWGMAAREGDGKLEVGVAFAPILVAQVIGEDSWLSEFEACLPKNGGGISPLQRVAHGPSPTRETNGVAVDGSVSRDPTLNCFA